MPFCTPPKFRILVANMSSPGEPSMGINPTVTRMGFELQQIVDTSKGMARVAGPVNAIPAPSAGSYTVAITVLRPDFWDPAVAAPGPFYTKEEVQIGDSYFLASEEFGAGMGSGAGTEADIATSLAAAIDRMDDIRAASVGPTVYVTSSRPDGLLAVKASNDTAVLLGGYDFRVIAPGAITLTTAPIQRKTYYLVKPVKTQTPPVAF